MSDEYRKMLVQQIEANRKLIYGKWGLKKFDPKNPPRMKKDR